MLELAFGLDMIGPGRFRSLLKAIGESIESAVPWSPKAGASIVKPRWDRTSGKLWFGDQAIRKVRICSTPTRIERILDAFEQVSWQTSIEKPFDDDVGQADLHKAVNQLNKRLKSIQFRVRGGAREISWETKPM